MYENTVIVIVNTAQMAAKMSGGTNSWQNMANHEVSLQNMEQLRQQQKNNNNQTKNKTKKENR